MILEYLIYVVIGMVFGYWLSTKFDIRRKDGNIE